MPHLRAIQPDRLRIIHRHTKKFIVSRAEARPDRTGATEGLAGGVEGAARDGVRDGDGELEDVAWGGFEGVGGELAFVSVGWEMGSLDNRGGLRGGDVQRSRFRRRRWCGLCFGLLLRR